MSGTSDEVVRDVDDADAALLEPRDHLEQPRALGVRQRRGRLVEEQDLRLPLEHPRDLDELLLGHFEPAHLGARVDRDAEARRERVARAVVRRRPVDPAEAAARQAAEKDVLGDAQRRHEAQLLVHEADPETRGEVRRRAPRAPRP